MVAGFGILMRRDPIKAVDISGVRIKEGCSPLKGWSHPLDSLQKAFLLECEWQLGSFLFHLNRLFR